MKVKTPVDTKSVARSVAELVAVGDLIVLTGDLGAGKTCFSQGFAKALGVDQPVTSPTFALANEYQGSAMLLHHLDVYRLEGSADALDLDIPELLETGVTLIEWGERIERALPKDYLTIEIRYRDTETTTEADTEYLIAEQGRILKFSFSGNLWDQRLLSLKQKLAEWEVQC